MMRIFHLDGGRKYFCPASIHRILDTMARAGLTHLELYLTDNQGFRFGLEDRTVTTAFGSYDLTPCLGDGYAEGDKGPDGSDAYLTEADMEELFRHAGELGLEIIPVINMPGHMGAVLEHFPKLRYPGSRSSVDLRSPEAVAFALGLLKKYLDWFAARGCGYFHFGADEFANDLGVMGFDAIYRDGTMACFVDFVNRAVEIIAGAGLVPMAFNDGIYYGDDTVTYGRIDNRLMVCYWIQGWNSYFPADAALLRREGFRLVNAHHEFYCGLGRDYGQRAEIMERYDPRLFHRASRIEDPAGAMLCLWCDRAYLDGPDGGAAAAEGMQPVIRAFGRAMDKFALIK